MQGSEWRGAGIAAPAAQGFRTGAPEAVRPVAPRRARLAPAGLALLAALAAGGARAEGSPAGAWLAARAAVRAHDFPAATPLLDEALQADPSDPRLLEAAATAALAQGDLDAALGLAARLDAAGATTLAGRLAGIAEAGAREDWAGLLAALDEGRGASPLLDGLARGWAELGLGHREAALAAFDAVAAEPGLRAFGLTHKALALGALGEAEASAALLSLPASEGMQRTRRGLMAQAAALADLGRGPEALSLLGEAFGPAPDAAVAGLRDRVANGAPTGPLVADARAGLAEALLGVAAALPESGDALPALLHARAALAVGPGLGEAAVLAAARLEDLGQPGLAREAYGLVGPADPAFAEAEVGRAALLRREGRGGRAAEALAALARERPGLPEVETALGDALRGEGRWAEAEAAYGRAIAGRTGGPGDPGLWFAHYARAVAREGLGDWTGAEADLRRVLALRPGEPLALNRLGYGLVERGERLPEALGLIEAAAAAEPASGAVADSLGWALLRLGRAAEAVAALERAAALEPADPVVNDHLGDAYWAVGRTREARFQWARALSLDPGDPSGGPDPEALRRKLDAGLPDAGIAAGTAGAGSAQAGPADGARDG